MGKWDHKQFRSTGEHRSHPPDELTPERKPREFSNTMVAFYVGHSIMILWNVHTNAATILTRVMAVGQTKGIHTPKVVFGAGDGAAYVT